MSLARHAKRRDANEAEIIAALKSVGAKVLQLDQVDLLVNFRDTLYLLEVKSEKGKFTPLQKKLFPDWPVHIVRDTSSALLAIGALVK